MNSELDTQIIVSKNLADMWKKGAAQGAWFITITVPDPEREGRLLHYQERMSIPVEDAAKSLNHLRGEIQRVAVADARAAKEQKTESDPLKAGDWY